MKTGRYIGVFVLGIALGVGVCYSFAATGSAQAQILTPEERAKLQAEYDQLQQEIAEWQKVLDDTRAKKNTLQGDVTALDAQIKKAQAEINQRNITITSLGSEIKQKTARIATLQERLESGRESLAKMLRDKNETETSSLSVLLLSAGSLSDFFADVDNIDSVNKNLQELFAELRGVKQETEKEKQQLAVRQDQELDAKHEVEVRKTAISNNQAQKKELLTITKKEETAYQNVLAERQRRAQEIRNALFNLRDASGISFETALNYATLAQQKTGVRAAMILAILSQESDLGKNIGSCYVTDLTTGDGKGKNTGTFYERVMKAPRDTEPFETITSALGLNWASTPVSCPLGKVYTSSRGYGGATGPSQFIPSTWQLFAPRIDAALGLTEQPNPWDPKHAVMATALYLKDLGAAAGTYTSERNAACKYYSGRACDGRSPINYTYGNSVVAKADTFQNNIDFLNNL